jgi:SAM-dependent methyltransferase
MGCRQCVRLDISARARPTVICNLSDGIPLAENSVDVVIAAEILEHIAYSRRFMHEVRRVLVGGGVFVLSTPNVVSLKYRLAFLFGRIPSHAARGDYTYEAGDPTNEWGHVRDYSFSEIRKVLLDNGFRVVGERGTGMHWKGKNVVPYWLMPLTLSDHVVVKAIACSG